MALIGHKLAHSDPTTVERTCQGRHLLLWAQAQQNMTAFVILGTTKHDSICYSWHSKTRQHLLLWAWQNMTAFVILGTTKHDSICYSGHSKT